MPTVSVVRIVNIVSVTQSTNLIEGVRSVTIRADKGRLLPILAEGNLYPTGAENAGMPDFPVSTQVQFEQDHANMLAALGYAAGNLVIVFKKAGGGGNQTVTIANHQFRSSGVSQGLQDFGRPTLDGVAYSADGAALPVAVS